MPARTLSTWPGHRRGGWHAAAHELAVLVVVELEYCRQQFFIRVRRTSLSQDIYHDWTVAMAWSGAESLKGWYVDDNDKVARINRRAQAFRRRVRRFAKRHGFGKEVGGSSYAEDVYYATMRQWRRWLVMEWYRSGCDVAMLVAGRRLKRLSGGLRVGVTCTGWRSWRSVFLGRTPVRPTSTRAFLL